MPGVLKAVANVNGEIAKTVAGFDPLKKLLERENNQTLRADIPAGSSKLKALSQHSQLENLWDPE